MANDIKMGQELLNVPMGEMIRSMAMAIADGQWALDKSSMTVAELMSGQRMLRDIDSGQLIHTGEGGAPQVVDSRVHFGYTYEDKKNQEGTVIRKPQKVSMMELGFTPNFYQFVDTVIEVKIAIKMTGTTESVETQSAKDKNSGADTRLWWSSGRGASPTISHKTQVTTSQVDASYANKYGYSAEGASLLRTRLAPIPPPAMLDERLRELMEAEAQLRARQDAGEVTKIVSEGK